MLLILLLITDLDNNKENNDLDDVITKPDDVISNPDDVIDNPDDVIDNPDDTWFCWQCDTIDHCLDMVISLSIYL
jgi:hypothetical protein